MRRRALLSAAFLAILFFVVTEPVLSCTSVCLPNEGDPVVAYNFDWDLGEGLALINKRGTIKKSRYEPRGATWTARYGSITFVHFGRDNPMTGMNEKGLTASAMRHQEGRLPDKDDRRVIGLLELLQYNLDNYATVAQVVAHIDALRPVPITGNLLAHLLFADANGDAATVEFLNGKSVVHRGKSLPVRVLTNSTYEESLKALSAAQQKGEVPKDRHSLGRFVRGAMLTPTANNPVERGFEVLDNTMDILTRWSIVYELRTKRVHFKTNWGRTERYVRLEDFDLSCRTPVQMLDLLAPGSGDASHAFVAYTRAANRALLQASLTRSAYIQAVPEKIIDALAAHPDLNASCADAGG